MKLSEIKQNTKLIIKSINYSDDSEEKMLNNYGVISGESIEFIDLDSFKSAFFIRVDGNQYYINKPLAKRIEVIYE